MSLRIADETPLAPLTTLGIGGPARHFVTADDEPTLVAALEWARDRGLPVYLLGGGSNVVVGDDGVDGLVVHMAPRGIRFRREGDFTCLTAGAGETWDPLVTEAVRRGEAGVECLAGIPGSVGATPVQNVGAYGQEAADTVLTVRVLDTATLRTTDLPSAACGFGYRDSVLRREPGRMVVLAVTFALTPGGGPKVEYDELRGELGWSEVDAPAVPPSLDEVREAVLRLRRRKSMLLDPADENHRSAGSFFTNPVVATAAAARLKERLRAEGVPGAESMPAHAAGSGLVKLSAAWLIERAGIARGYRQGRVGVSTRHVLALVNLGGATAAELMTLAAYVRGSVHDRFGISLDMEPVCWGCPKVW
ncbi:MAG: UDP-N-acetylmuramate dehydrogenase [Actinobacteria bacterium]|nr:UDP-N-acetylmuramate dehydrogenase [Actinomycetota bacterium]